MVAPIGLLLLVTAALSLLGAPPVPRWVFVGALTLQLVAVASTLAIQLPIQMQLDTEGYDAAALDRLITTDLLFRKLPSLREGILVMLGLWQIVQAGRSAEERGSGVQVSLRKPSRAEAPAVGRTFQTDCRQATNAADVIAD